MWYIPMKTGFKLSHNATPAAWTGERAEIRTVVAALKRYGMNALGVVGERNVVAEQELGAKAWCEPRDW